MSLRKGLAGLMVTPILAACAHTDWKHRPIGLMRHSALVESSGLAASRLHEGVLWTHNDDGPAEVFAVRPGGRLISVHRLAGAENSDWEDIFADDSGTLYIFDNTIRSSGDYTGILYVVPEPKPGLDLPIESVRTVRVRFPPGGWDVEAVFVWNGEAFFVDKPWSGLSPSLFRLRSLESDGEAELVGTLPLQAMITGADISQDGTRIALSSYRALFIFEGAGDPEQILRSTPIVCPINARQIEGITWEGTDLILTNEQREVFRVRRSQWLSRDGPSIKSSPKQVPFLASKPGVVSRPEAWAAGRWLTLHSQRRSLKIGRVAWSPEGLHIGVRLPHNLPLATLREEPDSRPADWLTPGRLYLLVNPSGGRPVVFGEDDRCVVIGTSAAGELLWQARRVAPATVTVTGSQEVRPTWIELEKDGGVLLITLKPEAPGFSELRRERKIGFNLLVMGEAGEQLSWTPVLTPYSFDSPNYWGLLELK